MIAVADTSPLNYLILIEHEALLERLFGSILIPAAVFRERQAAKTPQIVKHWVWSAPGWLSVVSVPRPPLALREVLHAGECEAIILAEQVSAQTLLIDDQRGRVEASKRGVPIKGTLNLLLTAAEEGWIDFPEAVARLQDIGFRASPKLLRLCEERYQELLVSRSRTEDSGPER